MIDSLIRVGLVEYLSESDSYTIKKKDEYNELVDRVLEKIAV